MGARVAYIISYTMPAGNCQHTCFTAIETVIVYRALQRSGVAEVTIAGPTGILLSIPELLDRARAEAVATDMPPLKE